MKLQRQISALLMTALITLPVYSAPAPAPGTTQAARAVGPLQRELNKSYLP